MVKWSDVFPSNEPIALIEGSKTEVQTPTEAFILVRNALFQSLMHRCIVVTTDINVGIDSSFFSDVSISNAEAGGCFYISSHEKFYVSGTCVQNVQLKGDSYPGTFIYAKNLDTSIIDFCSVFSSPISNARGMSAISLNTSNLEFTNTNLTKTNAISCSILASNINRLEYNEFADSLNNKYSYEIPYFIITLMAQIKHCNFVSLELSNYDSTTSIITLSSYSSSNYDQMTVESCTFIDCISNYLTMRNDASLNLKVTDCYLSAGTFDASLESNNTKGGEESYNVIVFLNSFECEARYTTQTPGTIQTSSTSRIPSKGLTQMKMICIYVGSAVGGILVIIIIIFIVKKIRSKSKRIAGSITSDESDMEESEDENNNNYTENNLENEKKKEEAGYYNNYNENFNPYNNPMPGTIIEMDSNSKNDSEYEYYYEEEEEEKPVIQVKYPKLKKRG